MKYKILYWLCGAVLFAILLMFAYYCFIEPAIDAYDEETTHKIYHP